MASINKEVFPMTEKRFSLRIDEELLSKFAYIAESNARSTNGELQTIIKNHIAQFEKEHGKINLEKEN